MTFFEKTKRFFEPLKSNKTLLFLSIFKFAVWAIYALVSAYIIKSALAETEKLDKEGLYQLTGYFIIFVIVYLVISYVLRKVDWPYMENSIEKYIYKKYIPKIIELDNNYVESVGTGKFINIITTGKRQWISSLNGCVQQITMILIIAHKHRKIRTDENTERSRKTVRIIMSKNELIQNNGIQKSMEDIMESVDKVGYANGFINQALFAVFNTVRILSAGIRVFVIVFVGIGVIEGNFTQGEFASILALVIVFESFLFQSTEFYKNFTKDFSDIEKLWETLDDAPKMKGYDSGLAFTLNPLDITIKDISYGYNESKVFSDFSLSIKRGQKTALVGASGGGKTTLMKLIAGYLHPESGSISVMGNILSDTALKSYYPHIGYLTQDPSVFDATIRENLMSALPSLQRGMPEGQGDFVLENGKMIEQNPQSLRDSSFTKELTEALRLAHCDFVFEMEKGLDTEIGERGVRLSGGQKQRLAIAKIFLKDPEIILLDEPTSALDSFSEEKITEALDTLFRDRTVIIVAHRLQTVRKADEIIVIEAGQVVEKGDHETLVANGGIYARMLELQSGF